MSICLLDLADKTNLFPIFSLLSQATSINEALLVLRYYKHFDFV